MHFDEEDVWRGEVTNELRHIAQSVRDLQRQTHDLQCHLVQETEAHREYHAANEHRWGAARWCGRHPFRFAALVGAALAAFALGAGGDALRDALRLAVTVIK